MLKEKYNNLDFLDVGITWLDQEGKIENINESALKLLNVDYDVINGKLFKSFLNFNDTTSLSSFNNYVTGNSNVPSLNFTNINLIINEEYEIPINLQIVRNNKRFIAFFTNISLLKNYQSICSIENKISDNNKTISRANLIINSANILSELTHSEFTYIFLIPQAEEKGEPKLYFSDNALVKYSLPQVPDNFDITSAGLWVQPFVEEKITFLNEIDSDSFYIFNEIITLRRILIAPIFINGKVIGVIGMANKKTDYSTIDLETIKALTNKFEHMLEFVNLKEDFNNLNRKHQQTEIKLLSISNKLLLSEEKLEKTQNELHETLVNAENDKKVKTALLNNLSHEIRSPMNAIVGFSNMLSQEKIEETERKEFVKIIDSSSKRMLEIVNNIMDFSKLKSGTLKILEREYSINKLMLEVYLQNYPIIKSKHSHRVKFEYKTQLPDSKDMVFMDESKVKQVLNSIISNAIKNTKFGKILFLYEVKEDAYIQFTVSDTGVGIPKKDITKLFEEKDINPIQISSAQEGMGFGLPLSKGVVELMGGRLWFETKAKKGTTFYFTIPFKPINSSTLSNIIQKIDSKTKLTGKRILIVDDEPMSYQLLERILRVTGANIMHAVNGKEAVEIVKAEPNIDLVLMDLRMPVMDGFTATREIKKINNVMPVVVQTAFSMYEEEQKAKMAGCDDFISKPIRKEELLIKVMENISKY